MKLITLSVIIFALFLYVIPKISQRATEQSGLKQSTVSVDDRAYRVRLYLEGYGSPLAPASSEFIKVADKYKIDFRILVGIAGAESTFGKAIPEGSANPFGLGCWTNHPCFRFSSFGDAIEYLGRTLATGNPYSQFRRSGKVEDIAEVYLTGNKTRWTNAVSYTMEELK